MHYEIERKWMVDGEPPAELKLVLCKDEEMEQGYISVHPAVRIRREANMALEHEAAVVAVKHMLCFKSAGGLKRMETEWEIPEEKYLLLREMIGLPMIKKRRKTYSLENGLYLEVNVVDAGRPEAFQYAEVEFETVEAARSWRPTGMLAYYLSDEVTGQKGSSMGEYWMETRMLK